jgi:uncharacterized protein with HEPN domain
MPRRDWELRIKDIPDAVRAVQTYTEGMKYEAFVNDRKTVDAVIRNLIVIGEAASHLPDDYARAHPDIPWRDMADLIFPRPSYSPLLRGSDALELSYSLAATSRP